LTMVNMCNGASRCDDSGIHSLYSSPQPSYLISTYRSEHAGHPPVHR
jgi:hypothetical protein